jgi:glutamyl-Q tRNA(Asp) synthetase
MATQQPKTIVTRFAPSPTGFLHLGHAASALRAHDFAVARGGRFILRIEDIDQGRCRPDYVDAIYDDLAWLGLTWEKPVRIQSQSMDDYAAALERLRTQDLLYPCFCTRADILAATTAPHGTDGTLYPGTCKSLRGDAARIAAGETHSWRLHVDRALALTGPLVWQDARAGQVMAAPADLGDVVLARKDIATSYHLAVTVDDALQGVTHIVRGEDLFHATHIQRLLQALLSLPTPSYDHHALLLGADGKRLAKRDASQTLQALRASGATPADIRAQIALALRDPMTLVPGDNSV